MVLSLAFQLGFCCAALAVLTQPSPPSSLTLPIHPGPTLSTLYTIPIVLHEARVETTIDSYIIGYTSTQGVFSAFNCHSGTYTAVSGYARCCTDAHIDCPIYTACQSTSILKNDQYTLPCSGTGSQTVCVTGTIFESVGDNDPNYYINCWSTWTGGDWKATRQVPGESKSGDGGPPTGSKLAGIIVGAIVGCVFLVALGVFAAKFYGKLKKTLVALEGQVPSSTEKKQTKGTDKEIAESVAVPKAAVHRNSGVQPSSTANGLVANDESHRQDSLATIGNVSSYGPLEAPGSQLDPYEMGSQYPWTGQVR